MAKPLASQAPSIPQKVVYIQGSIAQILLHSSGSCWSVSGKHPGGISNIAAKGAHGSNRSMRCLLDSLLPSCEAYHHT